MPNSALCGSTGRTSPKTKIQPLPAWQNVGDARPSDYGDDAAAAATTVAAAVRGHAVRKGVNAAKGAEEAPAADATEEAPAAEAAKEAPAAESFPNFSSLSRPTIEALSRPTIEALSRPC